MRVDLSNALEERVGKHGLSEDDVERLRGQIRDVHSTLEESGGEDGYRFMDLPRETDGETIQEWGDELREEFDSFVNVGIGGSSLGAATVTKALAPDASAYFLDNVDPDYTRRVVDSVELESTVFSVVSKSGSTAETAANFLVVRDALEDAGLDWRDHVVVTTGGNGVLRDAADHHGLRTLDFPEVPGRYSCLSVVGLLSAAFAGIDVQDVLEGARRAAERCWNRELDDNPAYAIAGFSYILCERRGKGISVMMPYAERLETFAEWYSQLWAESLGKRVTRDGETIHAGQTPVKSVGVTDQHSLLQLFVEGPNDKFVTFVGVEDDDEVVVPDNELYPYLAGVSQGDLRGMELDATRASLVEAGRPNVLVSLKAVEESEVGELLQTYMTAAAVSGELFGVDPFNQPGVEAGKQMTYGLLGRKGYEDERERVEDVKKTLFDV